MTGRDLPISFSGPMVRGLLREVEAPGTGKTQTRRTIEPYLPKPGAKAAPSDVVVGKTKVGGMLALSTRGFRPRYHVGDRLYVREHWRAWTKFDDFPPSQIPSGVDIQYMADEPLSVWESRFRQAMHMPRWASRLTLTVTDVRVERLQDCSDTDALAEGIRRWNSIIPFGVEVDGGGIAGGRTAPLAYRTLWNHINGQGAWEANPWVAAYTFTVQLGNIDQIARAA